MKYKVTEKHPAFKIGMIILDCYLIDEGGSYWSYHPERILDIWIKKGWIEEIQPKEFTRDAMEKAFDAGIQFKIKESTKFTYHSKINFNEWIKEYVLEHNE